MGVKRVQKGKWELLVTKVDTNTGKRIYRRKTIQADRERDAQQQLKIFQQQVEKELKLKSANDNLPIKKMDQAWEAYIQDRQAKNKMRESVILRNQEDYQYYIQPFWGSLYLSKISSATIEKHWDWLDRYQKYGGGNLSDNTKLKAWRLTRALLKWMHRKDYLKYDLTQKVEVRWSTKNKQPKDILESHEWQPFLQEINQISDWASLMCHTLLYTGARFGEIVALTTDDINLEQKTISISKSVSRNLVNKPKNQAAIRTIPMTEALRADVRRFLAKHGPRVAQQGGRLFLKRSGAYKQPGDLRSPIATALKRANIQKHIQVHSLRRSYITIAREANLDLLTIQQMVGHSSGYIHAQYLTTTMAAKYKIADQLAEHTRAA